MGQTNVTVGFLCHQIKKFIGFQISLLQYVIIFGSGRGSSVELIMELGTVTRKTFYDPTTDTLKN